MRFYALGFIISFSCLSLEAIMLKNMEQVRFSYIIFTLPTAYFLFNLIIAAKDYLVNFDFTILGKISLFVYVIHPLVIAIILKICKMPEYSVFILTVIISTIIGYIDYIFRGMINAKCR
ncbi:hypothetical protein [Anaerostipes faecalis]|uniref:hypothetical protein n=1 Tax=Anaerostipes faecalis TaxID=2738446 RepID=UPI001C1E50C6|nr:hypothetical protein [Anaerostipes faecalis]